MRLDDETELTKLEKQLLRQDRKEFILEMKQGTESERKAKLLMLTKHYDEIVTTMGNDQDLKNAKAHSAALAKPYNDQKKMNEKLRRFVYLLNQDEGVE